MKKIVAILLVVVLMSAMFVVPAHAHDGEKVQPRAVICASCGTGTLYNTTGEKGVGVSVDECYYEIHPHYHSKMYTATYSECTHCNYRRLVSTGSYLYTYCPYAPNGRYDH